MDEKQFVILTVLKALNGERSIYGAYHLLQGKRSVQTIQDGTIFNMSGYFGILPLSREQFLNEVKKLVAYKYLEWHEKERVQVTNLGMRMYEHNLENYRFIHDFNGWKYDKWTEIVWLRLVLYVQTLSFLLEKESRFYPLTQQKSIQKWVKSHIPKNELAQKEQFTSLHHELLTILEDCVKKQALAFSLQLSSKHQIGLTKKQIAHRIDGTEDTVALLHKSVMHKICERAQCSETFPILNYLLDGVNTQAPLTESARKTYQLLQKGISLEEIQDRRQLKISTIEDHIVEIAHSDLSFQYRSFVSEEIEQKIFDCVNQLKTTKLRLIKNRLGDEYSYFIIRLVMAKRKVQNGL
ncbi:helix-turn-helix domain-containing protein [Bacillus sp. JCM 19034]|uniref:helix-turn-helix domain-containing protein n=1 Tax=Bacillus sp. JCM 19034 TaxID=1481928 RepID=UPI0007858396|nr:helix-turn-helix domain-containing protein [Bacillus sp. JCM 19034]